MQVDRVPTALDASIPSRTPSRTSVHRARVRYSPNGNFHATLHERVRRRLAEYPPGENIGQLAQQLTTGLWFYLSYAFLVLAPAPPWAVAVGACSLGLAMAGLLMIVIHDSAHYASSDRRVINEGVGWVTSAALGITSDWWQAKHNSLHHPYTNIAGFDDDIDIGQLVRVTSDQDWKPWHRYQHLYAFVLAPLMYLNMVTRADLRFIATGRVGHKQVARPTWTRAGWLIFKKLTGPTVLLVVAFALRPAPAVIAATLLAVLVAGAVVSTVFQVQHCVEGTVFPVPDPETGDVGKEWAAAQAEATADFAPSNRLLTWYSGGLNFHIEHHLFPKVAHSRLPELRPIVRATCAEFGVRQVEFPTFRAALRAHYAFLRRMGRKPSLV